MSRPPTTAMMSTSSSRMCKACDYARPTMPGSRYCLPCSNEAELYGGTWRLHPRRRVLVWVWHPSRPEPQHEEVAVR